jgi:hypothetical protein
MTTEHELRDLLRAEAEGPAHPADWDHVVGRGRRHRRAARLRTAAVLGGLGAAVVVAAAALTDLGDGSTTVVVDQPATTSTTAPAPTSQALQLDGEADARAVGVYVTINLAPADPSTGFDPCEAARPSVTETASDVVVRVVGAADSDQPWADCQSSPFSGWATIELTDPLGTRRLIDGRDGREIPAISATDLLFPTWLPAPFDLEHWDEGGGETGLVDRTFSWMKGDLFVGVRNAPLEDTVPLGASPGDGCVGDPIPVRGAQGSLCRGTNGSFTLMWDEGGWRRQIELGPVSDNVAPFTVDDVLAIADGLEPLA